jgi:CubicO group peptidase (beta-lactamase class C family)
MGVRLSRLHARGSPLFALALRVTACLTGVCGVMSCAAANPASIEQHGDTVVCCDPENEGLDSRALIELTQWVREQRIPLFSVLISRDGRLAYELYTSSLTRDYAHYQMSVTKSVVSALVGIAMDRRLIRSPDAAITETLPRQLFPTDGEVARFRTVTIRHVLGMSVLDAPDPPRSSTPEALERQRKFWSEPSRVAFALRQPLLADHGHAFQYNDITPVLATGLIQYAAGRTALEFAEDNLFKPMAFRNYEWMHQDRSGVDNGGYGLRLRPIDMQKFGLRYLNDGAWREQR